MVPNPRPEVEWKRVEGPGNRFEYKEKEKEKE